MLKHILFSLFIVYLSGACTTETSGQSTPATPPEQRKEKIIANLKLQIPALREREITITRIGDSTIEGFDLGSLVIEQVAGQHKFLVSTDDEILLLLAADPIDISKSIEEVNESLALENEQKAAAELARHEELIEYIEDRPVRGNPDAPVTLVEFSDFQCPFCARAGATVQQLLERYPDNVRLVYLHLPLSNHPWAMPAAIAAECTGQQSDEAFWTLHDQYFQNQRALNPENIIEKSKTYLTGIDQSAWTSCVQDTNSEAHTAARRSIEKDLQLADRYGIHGTPGFFVNGHHINGAQPLEVFDRAVQEALDVSVSSEQ